MMLLAWLVPERLRMALMERVFRFVVFKD